MTDRLWEGDTCVVRVLDDVCVIHEDCPRSEAAWKVRREAQKDRRQKVREAKDQMFANMREALQMERDQQDEKQDEKRDGVVYTTDVELRLITRAVSALEELWLVYEEMDELESDLKDRVTEYLMRRYETLLEELR